MLQTSSRTSSLGQLAKSPHNARKTPPANTAAVELKARVAALVVAGGKLALA